MIVDPNYQQELEKYELSMLLSGPHDKCSAILEIHPGAGGTESQDWGSMLLRMYTRWAEQHGYRIETVDYQDGEEAGIKSVTLSIEGLNAYGYFLKTLLHLQGLVRNLSLVLLKYNRNQLHNQYQIGQ